MSAEGDHRIMRAASVVAIVVHLAGIALYLTGGLVASGPVIDPLRPLPVAAIYAAPAVMAIAGLRGRGTLLLAAATASGVLAVFPFSLHSFVLAPAAVVYAIAYARVAAHEDLRSAMLAVVGSPLLLVAAFLSLIIQDHPACYEELESGEVIIDRDSSPTTAGLVIEPDSDVVRSGCTSDIIVWWEAAASLALSSAAVTVALLSAPSSRVRRRVSTDAE